MAPRDPFQILGTTIAGKYRVDRVLGEGGAGIVYAGFHLVVGAPIVIKCLKPIGTDAEDERRATESFLREARVLFSLTHANVVRLYDVGKLDVGPLSVPWVVLEMIDGCTLEDELLKRRHQKSPYSREELVSVLGPVLDAVAFAHEHGVAHRDLKPSNVMLTRISSGVSAKVVDFGIARQLDQRQTIGISAFTPKYAAPEQWDPAIGPSGPATDVFSLGLVIAETCTFEPALDASGAGIVASTMDPARRVRVTPRRPDLPVELDAVLERATRVRPDERYPNARALLDAFRGAMQSNAGSTLSPYAAATASTPILAPPPPPVTTSTPIAAPASRAPWVIAVAALFVALAVAATGMVLLADRNSSASSPPVASNTHKKSAPKGDDDDDTETATKKPHKKPKASPPPKSDDDDDDDDGMAASKPAPKPKKSGVPSVYVDNVMGFGDEGGVKEVDVTDVANKHLPALKKCFDTALAIDPSAGGKLLLMIDVDVTGATSDIMIGGTTTIADKAMIACAKSEALHWKYPPPKTKTADTMVTIVFDNGK